MMRRKRSAAHSALDPSTLFLHSSSFAAPATNSALSHQLCRLVSSPPSPLLLGFGVWRGEQNEAHAALGSTKGQTKVPKPLLLNLLFIV